jgi:tRNA A37 threonylcarbamoyladenosine modification protein TsaB
MKVYISTALHNDIILELREGSAVVARRSFEASHRQAEKLLPALEKLLKTHKKKLSDILGIIVENNGLGFTALRIGVSTANALAYALGVPLSTPSQKKVALAQPLYSREPSITKKKK